MEEIVWIVLEWPYGVLITDGRRIIYSPRIRQQKIKIICNNNNNVQIVNLVPKMEARKKLIHLMYENKTDEGKIIRFGELQELSVKKWYWYCSLCSYREPMLKSNLKRKYVQEQKSFLKSVPIRKRKPSIPCWLTVTRLLSPLMFTLLSWLVVCCTVGLCQ